VLRHSNSNNTFISIVFAFLGHPACTLAILYEKKVIANHICMCPQSTKTYSKPF
jgi:hypothetical protein